MMSQIPINLENVKKEDLDNEILRTGVIAELDAINLYEQMAAMTENDRRCVAYRSRTASLLRSAYAADGRKNGRCWTGKACTSD